MNTEKVVPIFDWCCNYVYGIVRRALNLRSPYKLWHKKEGMTLGDGKKVINTDDDDDDDDVVFALGTLDEEGFVSLYLVMDERSP